MCQPVVQTAGFCVPGVENCSARAITAEFLNAGGCVTADRLLQNTAAGHLIEVRRTRGVVIVITAFH
jgi:hypothetical protein